MKDAICVPNEAIVVGKTGEPAVMVIAADGTAKAKAVKVGVTDGKDTQITDGLAEGDQVVTKGAFGMDDGTKVKVIVPGADDDDKPSAGKPEGNGDEK